MKCGKFFTFIFQLSELALVAAYCVAVCIHVKLRWKALKRGQVAKYLESLRVGRQCGCSRHGVKETCINSEQSNCHAMSTVN